MYVDLFVFLKGKDSITIQMNEKGFYLKDFFWTEGNICYGCVQDACHYANSWMMNVCKTLFHFLVTQGVKTLMPELGCRNPDMHENLNAWWKKVGCVLSFDFSMRAWVNCFICNHQTHWFWMFHESEGCHTSRGPTSEMIIFLIFYFATLVHACLISQVS